MLEKTIMMPNGVLKLQVTTTKGDKAAWRCAQMVADGDRATRAGGRDFELKPEA